MLTVMLVKCGGKRENMDRTGHSFLEQRGKALWTSKLRSRRLGEGIEKGVGGTWHLAHPWLLPCG